MPDTYLDAQNHSIPFILGIFPSKVHCYFHPFPQKIKIENIVQELLEVGFTFPSTSPYSSLIVMALRKEGTWCMCPYFHAFNTIIIKNKFLISFIHGLLDELIGAPFFLPNLISHMNEDDIPETNFHTHGCHYDFLVMLFGLCNSPKTTF